jgi:hypothetical protein
MDWGSGIRRDMVILGKNTRCCVKKKERQNNGRRSPLIYINPPLLI